MTRQNIILIIALALFALLSLQPPLLDMPVAAWYTGLVALLMAVLWMTVALPLAATALLPLILLPLLDVQTFKDVAPAYADPVLLLFFGAMLLGAVLEQQGLPRRLVLMVTRVMGCKPRRLIGGMMMVTFFISMWISNTATVAMILPLALALIHALDDKDGAHNFGRALILGIAYAAITGGSATLIGTPPNALFAALMQKNHGITIQFLDWMIFATPMALLMLVFAWFMLVHVFFPQDKKLGETLACSALLDRASLPPISLREGGAAGVFLLTAVLWIAQPWLVPYAPWLSDGSIAMVGAVLMFVLRLGDESTFRKVAWDVLVLLGGGLALAGAITESGLGQWLATQLGGMSGVAMLLIIIVLVAGTIALSELASNTAIVAAFVPVTAALAPSLGVSPLLLAVPLTLAASFAFMLPAGTPSSALAFSSGRISVNDMLRAGFAMNIMATVLITLFTWFLAEKLLLPA